MTNELVGVIAAVGLLLPGLTALIQRQRWTTRTRTFAAVTVSILAGIVGYTATEGLTFDSPSRIAYWIVGVVLIAGTTYKTIWQPSGAAGALESATNRPKAPEGRVEAAEANPARAAEPDADPDTRPGPQN